jgi:hypothetical protein
MYIVCYIDNMSENNSCSCCAERRMLSRLRELSRREGNAPARFVCWAYRKFGEMTIQRTRRDGVMGTSLPCVICRKVLDRLGLPWRAHINEHWVYSTDLDVPDSKPTNKQRHYFSSVPSARPANL